MSKHPPWVTFLFVKCVTYKSTAADCILMKLEIMMHFATVFHHRHFRHYTDWFSPFQLFQKDVDHFPLISMTIKHTPKLKTCTTKQLRLSKSGKNVEWHWMLVIWQFREHPWNDVSNSGILRSKQTLRYVITTLMNSSAWLEDGDGQRQSISTQGQLHAWFKCVHSLNKTQYLRHVRDTLRESYDWHSYHKKAADWAFSRMSLSYSLMIWSTITGNRQLSSPYCYLAPGVN